MEQYKIKGGKRIEGSIDVCGSKNAALPILAASILTGDECLIEGCPEISDVDKMKYIIKNTGGRLKEEKGSLIIDSSFLDNAEIPRERMQSMRSSVFMAGPLLSRLGHAEIYSPGGCRIGRRPIDMHISVLEAFGVKIDCEDEKIVCEAPREGLTGADIKLQFPSVGATENAICAAVCAKGNTIIRGAAREPEIEDLAEFLKSCGAKIEGAGSNIIKIEGVKKLHGTHHKVISDRIEGGTFMLAAAATGGRLFLRGGVIAHMEAFASVLALCGCGISVYEDGIEIYGPQRLRGIEKLVTAPHPGFPTDMQPQMMAVLAAADGDSLIEENIFENRFATAKELNKMGACIEICGRNAIIKGVRCLKGADTEASDLRGGAALVVAALAADGESSVSGICHIERGYCRLGERLASLGADIRKEKCGQSEYSKSERGN